jgi:hypothetical protein
MIPSALASLMAKAAIAVYLFGGRAQEQGAANPLLGPYYYGCQPYDAMGGVASTGGWWGLHLTDAHSRHGPASPSHLSRRVLA